MFKWVKSLTKIFSRGVHFPEDYFVLPISINTGDQEITVELDKIVGDFDKFDEWLKNTIVRSYPEEKLVFWCFRELWRQRLEAEKLKSLKVSVHIEPPVISETPSQLPLSSHIIDADYVEQEPIEIKDQTVTLGTVESTPLRPKEERHVRVERRRVILETEDGPVTYEVPLKGETG